MKKPITLTMVTVYDKPLEVSIADLLFVMPVLAKPDKIQAYTKEGCVFLGDRIPFEMAIKENQQHQLDSLGNKVWIDRVYWSDAKQKRDGYRTLCALGGTVELKPNGDVLGYGGSRRCGRKLCSQRGWVYNWWIGC